MGLMVATAALGLGLVTSYMHGYLRLYLSIILTVLMVGPILYWLMISHYVDKALGRLSQSIQSLIEGRPKATYAIDKDNTLSKLQSQVLDLSIKLQGYHAKEKIEKEKLTSLIGDISHQLMTPLSNLMMYNELLMMPDLDPTDQEQFKQQMTHQLDKLDWLIQSLVKMSRVESGCIQLNKRKTSFKDTLDHAVHACALKAQKREITLHVEDFNDIMINHDRKWTQEALFNVIDNSIKYSPKNTCVTIRVRKDNVFLEVQISDQGQGIEKKDYNNIFKRFYRLDSLKTPEGVGLGLFLAQEILIKQGGYIHVSSRVNHGSTFSIHLLLN